MVAEPVPDRRHRRRLETIEEVLDIAVDITSEQGVAGLSVGEIARRMGIRPPSLYVYFPSKAALYDALFARGARSVLETVRDAYAAQSFDGVTAGEALLADARVFVRWTLENPAYSQLLFWRPVPGFTPSAEAYAPAVQLMELSREWFADLQQRGLLRDDVDTDDLLRDWTVLMSGVVSQQLANAPGEQLDEGRFTAALPSLVAMFVRHYGPPAAPAGQRRRRRHADAC